MEIKNQLEQCPNGHYYNSALHPTCPICAPVSYTHLTLPTT